MDKERAALPIDDVIMSEQECARLLGLAHQTLINKRKRGEGPPFFQVTNVIVRYSKTRVLEWLESRTVEGVKVRNIGESEG